MDRAVITRKQAYVQGAKRFFTGVACNEGHTSERYTSNGACIDCVTFKTPNKRKGPRGTNVGWPARGLVFPIPGVTPEEMAAAFLFIEAMGWHVAAVQELRKDPKLMDKYGPRPTLQEQAELQNAMEVMRRRLAATSSEG